MLKLKESSQQDCPIQLHKTYLQKKFIEIYKSRLTQKTNIDFESLFQVVLENAGIETYSEKSYSEFYLWFENIYNIYFLKEIFNCNEIQECIIDTNGFLQILGNEKKLQRIEISKNDLQLSFETIAQKASIEWNYSNPHVSFYLEIFKNKFRGTLIHESCSSLGHSKLFLRKHSKNYIKLESFCNEELAHFLKEIIRNKSNIIISGATSSGKTTLLRSLIKEVPDEEHLICIEDTYEIFLKSPYHTSLLASDLPKKSLKDFCSYALRMTPERLVLGEIRSHEIIPFLLNLNTGHKGIMATTHANSCKDAIERLALLYSLYSEKADIQYQTIVGLLSRSLDYVIHLENKKIKEIIKVYSSDGQTINFENIFKTGQLDYESMEYR